MNLYEYLRTVGAFDLNSILLIFDGSKMIIGSADDLMIPIEDTMRKRFFIVNSGKNSISAVRFNNEPLVSYCGSSEWLNYLLECKSLTGYQVRANTDGGSNINDLVLWAPSDDPFLIKFINKMNGNQVKALIDSGIGGMKFTGTRTSAMVNLLGGTQASIDIILSVTDPFINGKEAIVINKKTFLTTDVETMLRTISIEDLSNSLVLIKTFNGIYYRMMSTIANEAIAFAVADGLRGDSIVKLLYKAAVGEIELNAEALSAVGVYGINGDINTKFINVKEEEYIMSTIGNLLASSTTTTVVPTAAPKRKLGGFGNMINMKALASRVFRKLDNAVWSMTTGLTGFDIKGNTLVLTWEDDEPIITNDIFDGMSMEIPAYAMITPIEAIEVGDAIVDANGSVKGWVVDFVGNSSFKILKMDGTTSEFRPPKTNFGGLNGAMVVKSLFSTGGSVMQSQLPMMMMMMGDDSSKLDEMLPLMLFNGMSQQNPMMMMMMLNSMKDDSDIAGMLPMLMMSSMGGEQSLNSSMINMLIMQSLMGDKSSGGMNPMMAMMMMMGGMNGGNTNVNPLSAMFGGASTSVSGKAPARKRATSAKTTTAKRATRQAPVEGSAE